MNPQAGRNGQFFNQTAEQGKDNLNMATGMFADAIQMTTKPRHHIARRRWLQIIAALAGLMMVALQTAPALASRAMLEDNPNRTGIGRPRFDSDSAVIGSSYGSRAGQSYSLSGAGLSASSGIQTLEDAIANLRDSQQPDDDGIDIPAGDADEAANEPDADAELAQSETPPLVVTDEFTSGESSTVWTGQIESGEAFVSEEDGGWYIMIPDPGTTLPVIATGQMEITDGQIITDARFAGDGAGELGLFGRSAIDNSTYYYCGVDVYGGAACHLFDGGQWYELFRLAPGEVARYQMDRLVLDIYGDTLTFAVNDQVVGSYTGAGVAGGSWGLATACYEGYCTGSFDFVDIYDYGTTSGEASTTEIVSTDFVNGPEEAFFSGSGDWGSAGVIDGWYAVSLAPELYFPNEIGGTGSIANGIITADVALDGEGAFGVVARLSTDDEGYSSYYVCWVNSYAFANCHVVVDDAWYEIEGSAGAEVTLEDVNRLSMGVHNDQIFFGVNGQLVTDAVDKTLSTGAMGFYHEAFAETPGYFTSYVDLVIVESLGGNSGANTIASDMNENDLGLYVGSGDWGFADFIYDGLYTTELEPGWTFPNPISGSGSIQTGLIETSLDFGGSGSAGLIARYQENEAGQSYYVCWVDAGTALAGCHLVLNGDWYTLAVTENPVPLDIGNEMLLAVNGSEIYFAVNGEWVIETVDDTLSGGDWGFYSDSTSDGDGFWMDVDSIAIEEYPGA